MKEASNYAYYSIKYTSSVRGRVIETINTNRRKK